MASFLGYMRDEYGNAFSEKIPNLFLLSDCFHRGDNNEMAPLPSKVYLQPKPILLPMLCPSLKVETPNLDCLDDWKLY